MSTEKPISANFPFESKYLDVKGSKMHYIDEGEGEPILFLHGNPTSSYLWRNIIPYLTPHARCIAPDLIGMGKSDKPNLDYRYHTHYAYLEEFIEKMGLKNVTLVIHDWGSGLGFNYAFQHKENIRGIAFMEAIIGPITWDDFPKEFRTPFKLMRTSGIGWFMLSVLNIFVKQILPQGIVRPLTKEEQAYYEMPYPTVKSRKPVRQWPREIPIEGKPSDVHETVSNYHNWLKETPLPKLFFYAEPGGLIPPPLAEWVKQNFPNITAIPIGPGAHFVQEDNPHTIGEELQKWYAKL